MIDDVTPRPKAAVLFDTLVREDDVNEQITKETCELRTIGLLTGKAATREDQSALGQFLTPHSIARFMASLFTSRHLKTCRLVDAGAGLGELCGAFLDRWSSGGLSFEFLDVAAFEIDERLLPQLSQRLDQYQRIPNCSVQVLGGDFIELATLSLLGFMKQKMRFTHAILNPPYKKIATASKHRQFLRKAGIETVNMYSGFLGLVVRLLEARGEIVAIIPRSFCNGPYYKSFRKLLLAETAIRHIHLFESRSSAFSDDAVLQENVILLLEKGGRQESITISTSKDATFADIHSFQVPFGTIVQPEDGEHFIHIPTSPGQSQIEMSPAISHSLSDLQVEVSTGPVVDFRVRSHLRAAPEAGTVPLLYPSHFVDQQTIWPRVDHKKPNALVVNSFTERSLYPIGFYTVVRRFSSKEESRRIVANTVSPGDFSSSHLGFENHLNVFHHAKHGLDEDLAKGLAAFLNSTAVDVHFRRFNGHTQVNATDLRTMKYPSRAALIRLGQWSRSLTAATQVDIDREIGKIA